jgi:hypothetical protein
MDLNYMCARFLIFVDSTRSCLEIISEFNKNNNAVVRHNLINKMHLCISFTMILYNDIFLKLI